MHSGIELISAERRPESFSMAALMQTESCTIFHLYSFAIVPKDILRTNILIMIKLLRSFSLSPPLLACFAEQKTALFFSSSVYSAAANFFC